MTFDKDSKDVLVLEDIESFKLDIEKKLRALNYNPHSAESREEFLEVYRKTPLLYAVILDNNVPFDKGGHPEADVGIDLARHFLRREEGVKIALHTSTKKNNRIYELEKDGVIYLSKPALIDDIKAFLE